MHTGYDHTMILVGSHKHCAFFDINVEVGMRNGRIMLEHGCLIWTSSRILQCLGQKLGAQLRLRRTHFRVWSRDFAWRRQVGRESRLKLLSPNEPKMKESRDRYWCKRNGSFQNSTTAMTFDSMNAGVMNRLGGYQTQSPFPLYTKRKWFISAELHHVVSSHST